MRDIFTAFKHHKTLSLYLNSTIILFCVGLLASLFTYRYIDPEFLGIWTTVTTFEVYATFLRLGIPNGMNRELPYELGTKNVNKALSYASTTLAYSLFVSCFLVIFFPILFCFKSFNFQSEQFRLALIAVLIRVIIEPYTTYLSGTFRTSESFEKLSKIQNLQALIRLITIFLVVKFSFKGLIIRELIIVATNFMQLHISRPLKVKPHFQWDSFKVLFKVGFPIFLISFINSTIDTFPRFFLIRNGDSLQLGLFTPISVFLAALALIPSTITAYLYPRFSFSFGQDGDSIALWEKLKSIYGISIILSLFVSTVLYFSIDYLIGFFPKYTSSVPYIKLSCIAALFVGFKLGSVLMIVLKSWKWLWIYTITYGFAQLFSLLILDFFIEDKLQTVVISLIVTSFLLFFVTLFCTYKSAHSQVLIGK